MRQVEVPSQNTRKPEEPYNSRYPIHLWHDPHGKGRIWLLAWRMLGDFATVHPDALGALKEWKTKVEKASWNGYSEVKAMFPSVDAISGDRYIFDIGGNKYRLVCVIKFQNKVVLTKWIGTHAECDRIDPKTV